MRGWRGAVLIGLVLAAVAFTATRVQATQSFDGSQLDQLVAPVALYPDSLLMQVLMASTYPSEVVDADRWCKASQGLSDTQRQQQLTAQKWDPSVASLTQFPDVLSRMAGNLDWTGALGEAFLGQQKDVLAAVQRMRQRASAAGSLQGASQLSVSTSDGGITIDPSSSDQLYVPYYDPTSVYGSWGTSSWYWPGVMAAPYGYYGGRPLAFGAGVATGAYMFGGVNWGTHSVYVNNNYWNNPVYRPVAGNSVYARNASYSGANVNVNRNTTVSGSYGNVNVNRNTNVSGNYGSTNVNRNTNVNSGGVNRTTTVNGNQTWQYDAQHRQGANFQNTSLQQKYTPTTSTPGRGYGYGGASIPAAPGAVQQMRSPQAAAPGAGNTGFGHYGNGSSEYRASSRGAMSTGTQGAGFDRGAYGGGAGRSVYGGGGGYRGGGGGFRGGRR